MVRNYLVLGVLASAFLLLAMFAPKTDAAGVCKGYLLGQGWETEGDVKEEIVTLPKENDAVWAQYLALQRENGFDLTPFCGREVRKLVFSVTNHPSGGPVYATIYWADGGIIGGDIMSPALAGFMHGLRAPNF